MKNFARSVLSACALAALVLGHSTLVASAAEPSAACRAERFGDPKLKKAHSSSLGACFDTDRGDDPHGFGRTKYRRQTVAWRDRHITLRDGSAAVEEFFCRIPLGIIMQVYRCPCGIDTAVPGRGACRSTKP